MRCVTPLCLGVLLLAGAAPAGAAPTKEDVAALVKQLQAPDLAARNRAAAELEKLGPDARDGVPVLVGALKEKEESIAELDKPVAVRALAGIGAAAVPDLIEALQDKDAAVHAARALKLIGPAARDAVPALSAVSKKKASPADPLRIEAIAALGRIGPAAKEAVPVLTEALKEKMPFGAARLQSAIALGQIGPAAREAVPALADALKVPASEGGPLRFHAATALGQIGPEAKAAVPALVDLLKDKKLGPARGVAAEALGSIGPDARAAVPALKEAAAGSDISDTAAKALERIAEK